MSYDPARKLWGQIMASSYHTMGFVNPLPLIAGQVFGMLKYFAIREND